MALLISDNSQECGLKPQTILKIKPRSTIAVLFSYDELFMSRRFKHKNSKNLQLLLALKKEKNLTLLPVPLCSADQKTVEKFNEKALRVNPEGFYAEGPYFKPIFLSMEILRRGTKLLEFCKRCPLYLDACPGCFGVLSEKNLNAVLHVVLEQIKQDQFIADIGCGQGFYIKRLLRILNNPIQLFLVDPKTVMLKELLKSLDSNNRDGPFCICSLAENLSLKPGYFDTTLLINSFSHFFDPPRAVQNIFHILKGGGLAYLIDENRGQLDRFKVGPYSRHNNLSAEAVKNLFLDKGFKLKFTVKKASYYLIVFEKPAPSNENKKLIGIS